MRFSADDEYKKQEPKLVCFSKIGSHKSHVTLKRGHFPGGRSGQLTVARLFGGQAGTAPDTLDCHGRRTAGAAHDCQGRRTAGAAKDDGQLGLPRTTDSWGRYPLQDLGQTVVSIVSLARDLGQRRGIFG